MRDSPEHRVLDHEGKLRVIAHESNKPEMLFHATFDVDKNRYDLKLEDKIVEGKDPCVL